MSTQCNLWVGIDPGKSGAVAFLEGSKIISIVRAPMVNNSKGKPEYSVKEMVEIFKKYDGRIKGVALELVHSMPKNGVAAMFSMGRGLGLWEGIIVALGLPYIKVSPRTWQKEILRDFNKGDDAKSASIINAERMFPETRFMSTEKCTKVDNNFTDAANLALFCKFKFL